MKDYLYVEDLDRARALLSPRRVRMLEALSEVRTCSDLARELGGSSQQAYYHVKALEKAGLVEKVSEKRVRGIMQGYYRAAARDFGLSPGLVGGAGHRPEGRQVSLGFLRELAGRLYHEVSRLADRTGPRSEGPPSLGMSAQITLPDASRRAEFLSDVQSLFRRLTRKYSSPNEPTGSRGAFRLALACYPVAEVEEEAKTPGSKAASKGRK